MNQAYSKKRGQTMDNHIRIRGAKQHNLKNISLSLPKNSTIVFTGLSGSGKSSLAFDTIYAEGQRRYIESLSAYARQFLGQMDKPNVEHISGLSPAISIDQKSGAYNPRSTVGTITEIYDYLRVLFSSIGKASCPTCHIPVVKMSIQEMTDYIYSRFKNNNLILRAPLIREQKGEFKELLANCRKNGFIRVWIDGETYRLEDVPELNKQHKHSIDVIIDRLIVNESSKSRLFQSIETALGLSGDLVFFESQNKTIESLLLSSKLVCPYCKFSVPELTPRLFSFNSPLGACPSCNGLGYHNDFSEELLLPSDTNIPLCEAPFTKLHPNTLSILSKTASGKTMLSLALLSEQKLSLTMLLSDLNPKQRKALLEGTSRFQGLLPALQYRYKKTSSDLVRNHLRKFMEEKPCLKCQGQRLKKETLHIHIHNYNIGDFVTMPIDKLLTLLLELPLSDKETLVTSQLLREITERLTFLVKVGLGYLTLSRKANTLSGGEYQRIRLATQIGLGLTGVLYVLDEPSIGLHPRDNNRLIKTLHHLRDIGNTLIIVEHDIETIKSADYIVHIGPGAGEHGGYIEFSGTTHDFLTDGTTLTAQYINKKKESIYKVNRDKPTQFLSLENVSTNNLKNLSISFPLHQLVSITGVSGSGKSTLIHDVLSKVLIEFFQKKGSLLQKKWHIKGLEHCHKVVMIDQSPIGRTPRSNPATYIGLFSHIRELFASTKEARIRGYNLGRFSFNVSGGRCENCSGDGKVKIEMHFFSDVYITCEVCKGTRYNQETLDVRYQGKNISDVLNLTVDQAVKDFENIPTILRHCKILQEVGLGYIKLGQSATTLSGGEAQRIKLSKELLRQSKTANTVYLLDEPTTGLHTHDVLALIKILHRLVDKGNSVMVIEHNLDLIYSSNYIIDLGPEGGENGGQIVVEGALETIINTHQSYTGQFLKEIRDSLNHNVS